MRGIVITLGIAALFVSAGIVTLGLPGAVVFVLHDPLLRLVFGPEALERLPPDSMWPIAIVITLLWPVSLIIGYLAAVHGVSAASRMGRFIVFTGIVLGWNAMLAVGCYSLAQTN